MNAGTKWVVSARIKSADGGQERSSMAGSKEVIKPEVFIKA